MHIPTQHNKGGNNVPVWIEYQDKGLQVNFKGIVAVYCSVLQCIALCYSVSQCFAVCCSVYRDKGLQVNFKGIHPCVNVCKTRGKEAQGCNISCFFLDRYQDKDLHVCF